MTRHGQFDPHQADGRWHEPPVRRLAIVDQDEVAALAAARLVPERELKTASTVADQLLPLVERRAKPFGEASRSWF